MDQLKPLTYIVQAMFVIRPVIKIDSKRELSHYQNHSWLCNGIEMSGTKTFDISLLWGCSYKHVLIPK
jgi:hypothetical protein